MTAHTEWKKASTRRLARFVSRERLIAGSVALVFLGLFLFLALRWFEHAVTFHPLRYDDRTGWKQPPGAEDVWLTTTDGVRLHGWFFEARNRPAHATIIHSMVTVETSVALAGWENAFQVADSTCFY